MAFAVLELFFSRKETVFICRQRNTLSKKSEWSNYTTKAEILETPKIFMLIPTSVDISSVLLLEPSRVNASVVVMLSFFYTLNLDKLHITYILSWFFF